MANLFSLVYWDEPTLWSAIFAIVITPVYWITVSWFEFHTGLFRQLFCSRHLAFFLFAITQIFMICYRNTRFIVALQYQPKWSLLQENPLLWLGYTMFIIGILLVIRSYLSLGFFATFMGDFFGLNLSDGLSRFPYTWMKHPMYTGSFMMFLGIALVDTSQAGLLLAMLAGFVYSLAAYWEEPYMFPLYYACSKKVRTVGVQVSSTSSLVWVAARTIATQVGEDVEIIKDNFGEHLYMEVEGASGTGQLDGAMLEDSSKYCDQAVGKSSTKYASEDSHMPSGGMQQEDGQPSARDVSKDSLVQHKSHVSKQIATGHAEQKKQVMKRSVVETYMEHILVSSKMDQEKKSVQE